MSLAVLLVSIGALTFSMIVVAAFARSRPWTPAGMRVALGNRDDVPEPSPFASRADRAAKNMLENVTLFAVLLLAASFAGVPAGVIAGPSAVFLAARGLYAVLYWAGVPYVRTLAWLVAVLAMAWIGWSAATW